MSTGSATLDIAASRARGVSLPRVSAASVLAWCGYIFLLLPILVVVPMSFGGTGQLLFPPRHFSVQLYLDYFGSAQWRAATLQSLYVGAGATCLAVLISVPAAYALVRSTLPGTRVYTLLLISPMLTPGVVMGLGYELYFGRIGLAGTTVGMALAHATLVSPFVLTAAISGFKHLDPNLETAAAIIGAGPWTIFRRVVLPQVWVALLGGTLLAFAVSFDEVVIAYFLSGATSATLPVRIYSTIRWEISPVIAAISSLLTAVSFIVSLALIWLQRERSVSV